LSANPWDFPISNAQGSRHPENLAALPGTPGPKAGRMPAATLAGYLLARRRVMSKLMTQLQHPFNHENRSVV
jgi:hypothetical protein